MRRGGQFRVGIPQSRQTLPDTRPQQLTGGAVRQMPLHLQAFVARDIAAGMERHPFFPFHAIHGRLPKYRPTNPFTLIRAVLMGC